MSLVQLPCLSRQLPGSLGRRKPLLQQSNPPISQYGRGKGRGRGRGKGKRGKGKWKPCGDEDNLTQCTCQDEESYTSYADLKENCRKENPLVTCTCEDGDEWTPPKKPANKRKPCGDEENLEECTCLDETTYTSYDEVKENCKSK